MRPVHFRMLSIVIVPGLAAGLIGCAKSEAPQPPANNRPATTRLANTAAPSPAMQPSPQPAAAASTEAGQGRIEACALLTSKEIQSVQGEPLKEAKSSGRSEGGFRASQCFFTLPTFTNSVSLAVTQKGDGPGAREPKQFWKEIFHRDKDSEKARDKDRDKDEEEERSAPPLKISGVGDEAFWTSSRVGGALYILKGNAFIRVSVGGAGDQTTKIKKSKALAQMVLKHL